MHWNLHNGALFLVPVFVRKKLPSLKMFFVSIGISRFYLKRFGTPPSPDALPVT